MATRKTASVALVLIIAVTALTGSAGAFEFNDVKWDAGVFPIAYRVNNAGAPEGFAAIVEECGDQWHRVEGSSLTFRYSGITHSDTSNTDGLNTIGWDVEGDGFAPNVLAETSVRTANGFIVECDTVFNGSVAWSTTGTPGGVEYDLKTAVLREIGRWMQLGYVAAPSDSVMLDPLAQGVVKHTLAQDDIDAIEEVYPAPHEPDAYEEGDDDITGATWLALNTTQTDHNIFPYDDEDWYWFSLSGSASVQIATSGTDPLGDTEIYLYDAPPGPTLRQPTTASVLNSDRSYEFRVNIGAGIVSIGGVFYQVPSAQDFLLHVDLIQAPIDAANSDIIYTLVVAENGGLVSHKAIAGGAAAYGLAQAPSAPEIDAAVGHTNWVRTGDTLIHRIDEAFISQTVTPVTTDPIGHADNINVPGLAMPSTPSIMNIDGSHELRVNVTNGVVVINNSFYDVASQEDLAVASGGSSPLTTENTDIICSVVAYENEGAVALRAFTGSAAPAESAGPLPDANITAAIGHNNWLEIGRTRYYLRNNITQTTTTVFEPNGPNQNIDVGVSPSTVPSSYSEDGTYQFRINLDGGHVDFDGAGLTLEDVDSVVIAQGTLNSPFDQTNTSIIYSIIAYMAGFTSVAGSAAPAGNAAPPSAASIGEILNREWATIGHVRVDLTPLKQTIEEKLFDQSRTPAPLFAILETQALGAGTYYVKVQSSADGGRPVVDPYSIVLLPGSVDAFEWDDIKSHAKEIFLPEETQVRTISPAGDVDWAYFVLENEAGIVIETFGPQGGDTELLLDSGGTIATNDDKSEVDMYSRIEIPSLPPGTYYVRIWEVDPSAELISYRLRVSQQAPRADFYEEDDTPLDANELTAREPQAHSIDPVGDHDWMYFTLDAPTGEVNIETRGLYGDDTYIELYDAGVLVNPEAARITTVDNSGGGSYAKVSATNLSAGRYYVLVGEKDDDALIEEYEVTLITEELTDAYEYDDVSSAARVITPGVPMPHSLKPGGDIDWAKFTIPVSGALVIETSGDEFGDTKMWLYYEANGQLDLRRYNDDYGDDWYSRVTYNWAPAGTWYVQITGLDNSEVIENYDILVTYTEHLREPDDPGDTPQDAAELPANTLSADHSLSPLEDIDWFKLEITDLLDFEIEVTGFGELEVQVFNSSILDSPNPNAELAASHELGLDQVLLRYIIQTPDTYYIKVNEFDADAILDDYQIIAKVATPADFSVRPPWLNFEGSWQNPPSPQLASVSHRTQTTRWQVEPLPDWARVTPSSGPVSPGRSRLVQVAVNITDIPIGFYTTDITFTPDDGSPPSSIEMTYYVTQGPADVDWDTPQLNFATTEGTINPPAQTVTFANTGGGDAIPWTIDADKPWVGIEPASGTLYEIDPSKTISITPNIAGLLPGEHTALITLHGFESNPGPPVSQVIVTVTIAVDTVPPGPVSFQEGPHGVDGTDSIEMTAFATSDDQQGPVEYYFQFHGGDAGGADSGWISSRTFTLPGLIPGGYYTYRVKARDTNSHFNETPYSAKMSGYVAPAAPPAPIINMVSIGFYDMEITPGRGANSERVQLAIYNAGEGTYLGRYGGATAVPTWQTQAEWGTVQAVGLEADTEYSFQVVARNGQGKLSPKGPAATATTLFDNAAERPKWDPASPLALTSDSVSLRITSITGVEFEFLNVSTGETSGWITSTEHTFDGLSPCSYYEFKARAKNDIGNVGAWSVPVRFYALPLDPAEPAFAPGIIDPDFAIDPNTNGNPDITEYAIEVNVDKFVGLDGTPESDVKVWRTQDQWLVTVLHGFQTAPVFPVYQFRIHARNPDGAEADNPGPSVDRVIHFQPPEPNPAQMDPFAAMSLPNEDDVYVNAVPCIDTNGKPEGKEYYFECVDGSFPDSGWQTDYSYKFLPELRGAATLYRVKYRDFAGNETSWSDPMMITMSARSPGVPISRGSSGSTAYITINPGTTAYQNAPEAEYAIHVAYTDPANVGNNDWVTADNQLHFQQTWRTLYEWGDIVEIRGLATPSEIRVTTYVRQSVTSPVRGGIALAMVISGETDITPPTPATMAFAEPFPADSTATSLTITAIEATDETTDETDAETWVEYGFRREETGQVEWSQDRTHTIQGLTPATPHSFRVMIRDAEGNPNANSWSETRSAYTLAAVPNAPIIAPGTDTVDLQIDPNGNPDPSDVKYAIQDGYLWIYVAANNTLTSPMPVWKTLAEWGTPVTVGGLRQGSTHSFLVKAKSPEGPETVFGPATLTTTYVNDSVPPTPNPPLFAERVMATSAQSFKARAAGSVDITGPVEYKFAVTGSEGDFDSGWQTSTIFEPTGLAPGGEYMVTLQARDSMAPRNYTSLSEQVTVYVDPVTPGAPAPSNIDYITITLTFDTRTNSAETLYAVFDSRTGLYVDESGELASVVPAWRTQADWGPNMTVSGLEPGDTYYFAAAARSKGGTSSIPPYSDETAITTLLNDVNPPRPNPAQYTLPPAATSTTSFRAQAAVAEDSTPPVEFYFDVESPEGDAYDRNWSTSRLFEPTNLTPGGKYIIKLTARDSVATPNVTGNPTSVTIYLDPVTPGAPLASDIDISSATLSFDTGPNSDETLYAVYESTTRRYLNVAGSPVSFVPVWRTEAERGASFPVAGLTHGTYYYFSVVASSKDGALSLYSGETEVKTPLYIPQPGAPTLFFNLTGSVSLLLKLDALTTWSYTASFLIRVTGDSTPLYVQADNSLGTTEVWRTRAQWGNPICINGLNPDTSYTFDIRGKITDELSVWGVPLENVLTNMAGDATGNNVVDVFDMIFVRDHLGDDRCSGISFQADVNDDGIVNILDLTFIRSRPNFTD